MSYDDDRVDMAPEPEWRRLPTLSDVQAARTGKPIAKGRPRVLDRIDQKAALAAQERACRRAVRIRDHGQCVVPGCRQASKHLHHVVYRSRGGTWQTSNICSLCPRCHALVHAKLLTISGNADARLTIARAHS